MWFREVEEGIGVLTTEGSLMFWGFRLHTILILPKSVGLGIKKTQTLVASQQAGMDFLEKSADSFLQS